MAIQGQSYDLKDLARVQVRAMQPRPFRVPLPDGRTAVVTPLLEKVAPYLITLGDFEARVRVALSDLNRSEEPEKARVLQHIHLVEISVPYVYDELLRGFSLGVPLDSVARVVFEGARDPRVTELTRMRRLAGLLRTAVQTEMQAPWEAFLKRFDLAPGPKRPDRTDVAAEIPPAGRLHAWTTRDRDKVIGIRFAYPKPLTREEFREPLEYARAQADRDREHLLKFLKLKYRDDADRDRSLAGLLGPYRDLPWTRAEIEDLLGPPAKEGHGAAGESWAEYRRIAPGGQGPVVRYVYQTQGRLLRTEDGSSKP